MRHSLSGLPSHGVGKVSQWRGRLPAPGEQDVPNRHLRFSKRGGSLFPVSGVSLRDNEAGADKLRLLSVHLGQGFL